MRLSVASVNFGYERGPALCVEDEIKGYYSVWPVTVQSCC